MKSSKLNMELNKDNKSLDMSNGKLSLEEQEKMKIVDQQFKNPKFIKIFIPGNGDKKIKIEYVVLDAQDDKANKDNLEFDDKTVIYVPGFSVSYRATEKFIKLMAVCEGKRVINISIPSTGQSDFMPTKLRKWKGKEKHFESFADILNNSLDAIRESEINEKKQTTNKVSLVAQSLGAISATEMAIKYPDKVKNLVLIHPAGVNEENIVALSKRFIFEKVRDLKFQLQNSKIDLVYKEAIVAIFKDGISNTIKNPLWRTWEAFTISKGGMLKILPKVKANMYLVYGGDDKLFPASQIKEIRDNMDDLSNVEIDVIPKMGHDAIYHSAKRYSELVGVFLDKMREKGD